MGAISPELVLPANFDELVYVGSDTDLVSAIIALNPDVDPAEVWKLFDLPSAIHSEEAGP